MPLLHKPMPPQHLALISEVAEAHASQIRIGGQEPFSLDPRLVEGADEEDTT